LRLIAKGSTSGLISRELSLSVRTVEFYRISLMRKLGLGNWAILARIRSDSASIIPDQNLDIS
jgi:DNA-binding NarL/FixJ family response regulator